MESIEPMATSTIEPMAKPAKGRKAKSALVARGKRSLNLSLSQEDYERLALHALADGKTISDLVCELARTHLRRVHMARTPTRNDAA